MAGTAAGAAKAVATIKARDPRHFAVIGAAGGRNGRTGGFAHGNAHPEIAGRIGGRMNKGQKKCYSCLKRRHDVINGFCASPVCQSQDFPSSRALLGIDAKGRKLQPRVTKKANSASTTSTTSQTKHGRKPDVKHDAEPKRYFIDRTPLELSERMLDIQSERAKAEWEAREWLTPPKKRSLFQRVRDHIRSRQIEREFEREVQIEISEFGSRSSKGGA